MKEIVIRTSKEQLEGVSLADTTVVWALEITKLRTSLIFPHMTGRNYNIQLKLRAPKYSL